MIIELGKLQEVSQKILPAVDTNELSLLTETLELRTKGSILYMNVTNKEYYISVKLGLEKEEEFHATVNAKLFLKLVAQLTCDKVELALDNTSMVLKGNGTYKLPLIFEGDSLLVLPKISIENVTKEFIFSGDILNSILTYNSKEWQRGVITRPIQKLCYVDEKGAITFTSGACVNTFTLPEQVKLLFNQKLVKLFKLFFGKNVTFAMGYDKLSDTIVQTKVSFIADEIELTAIISCDDTLLNSIPVEAIRGRAFSDYDYSISFEKSVLLGTLNRLLLFSNVKNVAKPYGVFSFKANGVTIWDIDRENNEDVLYANNQLQGGEYVATLNIEELKTIIESCNDAEIVLSFGNHQAFVISQEQVKNIIPEIVMA